MVPLDFPTIVINPSYRGQYRSVLNAIFDIEGVVKKDCKIIRFDIWEG